MVGRGGAAAEGR